MSGPSRGCRLRETVPRTCFLANSYTSLRAPNGIDLRYERPPWVSIDRQPARASRARDTVARISQQEYARLFERDRLGVPSSSTRISRQWFFCFCAWTQSGSQYGNLANSAYAVEAFTDDTGQRRNNGL